MATTKIASITARDFYHFVAAFLGSFLTLWLAAGDPKTTSALYALVPGAASVAFRKIFPHLGESKAL